MLSLQQIRDGVDLAAQEFPIKKAELFGSYANGSSHADSDVDLLLEFTTPQVSLLTLNTVKYRLEELLKTAVDVVHGPLPENSILEIERRIHLYGA